jgi:hypothetical protein
MERVGLFLGWREAVERVLRLGEEEEEEEIAGCRWGLWELWNELDLLDEHRVPLLVAGDPPQALFELLRLWHEIL